MTDRVAGDGGLRGNLTVIELVPSIAPESFGLGYAGLNLAAALERIGVNVFLVSVDEEKIAHEVCAEAGFPRERYIRGPLMGSTRLRFSPSLVQRLSKIPINGRVIVHSHGLWSYMTYVAGALRKRQRCPIVLSPHGELEPYALTISPRKKALALLLYVRQNLKKASCLCATSEQEKASIRAYGYTGRVAVSPNGVNRANKCSVEEVAEFRNRHDVAPGARVMLFLSRIARIKNLPLLLKAFAKSVRARPDWMLLIAGNDERGHIHEVRALIQDLAIEKSVRLIGPVSGREKASAFTSASVFVLPSHSEGLPISVLEAMEYGKPLLLTDGWSLPVVTPLKFCWRVPADEGTFTNTMLEVMNTSDVVLAAMGESAKSIVREHFDWDSVAKQACSLYASLLRDDQKTMTCEK